MTNAKIAVIKKFGQEFTLINPVKDICIDKLCCQFGERTIKVNFINLDIFELEAINGIENHFTIEDIRNSTWRDIEIN